jgi:hypothetical protein
MVRCRTHQAFDQKAEFPACCMTTFFPRPLSQLKDSFPLNVGPKLA